MVQCRMGFVGYELPLLARAWASYFVSVSAESADGTDQSDVYDSARV